MWNSQSVQRGRFVSKITRETLALIMAGGRGSRLKQLTSNRAKPAVHFGGNYRIIDFALSNCVNSGIHKVGVLTQYKSHSLIKHLQSGWNPRGSFGDFLELLPADQTCDNSLWYAGTADAVYQNIECIRAHQPENVLILAGDHVYKMDYGPMLAHHVASKAQVTIGCIEVPLADASEFGVIEMDDDTRIRSFVEKSDNPSPMLGKPNHALASMGIYVFDAKFLMDLLHQDAGLTMSSHDFGKDVIPDAIEAGRVFAYPFSDIYDETKSGYWRDVGTVDAYWQANMELTGITPELNLYDEHWPIWTRPEQLPPAKFVLDDNGERGLAVDSLVSAGCIVSGATVHRSVMFVKSRVEPGSVIEDSLLLPSASVGRRCRIRKAIIDAGCHIPDGMSIGFDAENDARVFHRSANGVTLVTREMLDGYSPSLQVIDPGAADSLPVATASADSSPTTSPTNQPKPAIASPRLLAAS